MSLLTNLPGYLGWAHERAVRMLEATPTESGVNILAHTLGAERVWADRINGLPMSCPIWPDWTLEACVAAIPVNVEIYRLICQSDTGGSIAYKNSRGEPFTSSIDDILLHVFAHGAYHRGQISQAVRAQGGEIIDTDYIIFAHL